MPEYLSPGVYVEEVPAGPRPIEGVSTSTAGFVGLTERGPTIPRLVTSLSDYGRWFGEYLPVEESFLPYAIAGFFQNNGKRAFLARITRSDATTATLNLATAGGQTLQIAAQGAGEWGSRLYLRVNPSRRVLPDGTPDPTRFRLTVLYYRTTPATPPDVVDPTDPAEIANPDRVEPDVLEDWGELGFAEEGSNYVITTVNGASTLVHAEWAGPPGDRPNDTGGFVQLTDIAGSDGTAALSATDFEGDDQAPPNERTGLAGLETIDEISILCVPDEVNGAVPAASRAQIRNSVVDQCTRLADRFAVLQVEAGQGNIGQINPPRDTSYAAIYWPWIRVFNPRTEDTVLVPPGGHVAGIYARTDIERGVHKAPANEIVRGIILRDLNADRKPLEFTIGRSEHDILNPRGINVIRDFRKDRRGIRVWGARTLSSDPLWRYVNVRRLMLFIEESIDEGTQWVVFEPNHEPTWAQVRRSVGDFLTRVWRNGALQGATPDEAFSVRCDRTTMTQDDIDNGRLICVVAVAPVKPAEFVIFRISQKTAEAS